MIPRARGGPTKAFIVAITNSWDANLFHRNSCAIYFNARITRNPMGRKRAEGAAGSLVMTTQDHHEE